MRASGSPVVGLHETSSLPPVSAIQPSGPVHAPGLTSLMPSFDRIADGAVVSMLTSRDAAQTRRRAARNDDAAGRPRLGHGLGLPQPMTIAGSQRGTQAGPVVTSTGSEA